MAYSAKKDKVVKTVSIKEALSSFTDIIQKPMIAPHVYSLTFDNKKEILLASLETGNVIGFECRYDPQTVLPRRTHQQSDPKVS